MKKIYLPLLLAASLGLGACSSDNAIDNGGNNSGSTIDLSNGGYVKLNINLPTDKGSRATDLVDGLDKEFAVKDASLLLFKGTTGASEDAATFYAAYDLNKNDFAKNGEDQITITKRITTALGENPNLGANDELYALVVLNNNGVFTVDNTNHTISWGANIGHSAYTSTPTFINFAKAVSSTSTTTSPFASDIDNKGIFMANAPLCSNQGGSVDPTTPADPNTNIATLVNVKNSIATSEAAANSLHAADIYVERAVAKITMNQGGEGTVKNKANGLDIKFKVESWGVDNTSAKSYLVHQYNKKWNSLNSSITSVTGADKYRFVYDEPVNKSGINAKQYRVMWAEDPNYSDAWNTNNFKNITTDDLVSTFGNGNPQYCNENTFTVANQNWNQTTRVVLGVKLSAPGTTTYDQDLYIVNGNKENVYTKAALEARLFDVVSKESAVAAWAATVTNPKANITFSNSGAGATTITSYTLTDENGANDYTGTPATDVTSILPNITRYAKGVAYYAVRIKHFGDSATPWNQTGQGITAGDNSKIYPGASDDVKNNYFLGRYGVVRNNWYDISVNSVTTLGDPNIPALNDTPDDELSNYISVVINVLSWAKHSQSADI